MLDRGLNTYIINNPTRARFIVELILRDIKIYVGNSILKIVAYRTT